MTRKKLIGLGLACATVLGAPLAARAQGALSTQGFGYPLGQLSVRALGTGGALGEIDSRSPLNPAAIRNARSGEVFAQYDPEIRTVKGPSGSSRTVTARFPNFGINLPMGDRFSLGLSASTLLDRSWSTTAVRQQTIGNETLTSEERVKSEGGITDLRYGIALDIVQGVKLGLAGHHYTGRNNINLLQTWPDSVAYGAVSQTTSLNYSGNAFSAGLIFDLIPNVGIAFSGKKGGKIEMFARDTNLSQGNIPDHYAASLSFSGIPGTIIAARYAFDKWSAMDSLSTTGTKGVDGSELNVGFESEASRLFGGDDAIMIRLGSRWRTLPFQAAGEDVKEVSFGGGVGLPIARGRAALDIAVLRSVRSGVSGIKEGAFNFSFGISIQP